MFGEMLENVRRKSPLVHSITNYVTVNDCANMLLACGASPIMADEPGEVMEITSICDALNINIGTLNSHTIPSMLATGKQARTLNHPIILDPVGAGTSLLRTQTALELLHEVKFTVVRGNISEIHTLAAGSGSTRGVDAGASERISEDNLEETIAFVRAFARELGAIAAITGPIDVISDGFRPMLFAMAARKWLPLPVPAASFLH